MSADDNWRAELKKGDLIDGFDTTKVWYSSTIMASRFEEEDGKQIPMVKVAFRVFHPDGNREDEETKLKFFGWSEQFDEWMSAYNPRI